MPTIAAAERWLVCAWLLSATPLAAATPEATPPPTKTSTDSRATAVPPELLEFLGSWETATGAWNETIPDNERPAEAPVRRPKEAPRD